MDNTKIGVFITERRKAKNLTQQELADKLGVTVQAVSKWECGKCLPDVSIMQTLCGILDISINELLNGEPIPQPDRIAQAEKQIVDLLKERQISAKKTVQAVFMIIGIWVVVNAIIVGLMFLLIPSHLSNWRIIVLVISAVLLVTGGCELEQLVERKILSKLKKKS